MQLFLIRTLRDLEEAGVDAQRLQLRKPTMRKSSHAKNGFTLVELLVTITIIATLAGATFTLASRSKQAALSAKTINNLREIGVCSGLYMAENNNFYPPAWDNTKGANRSYAQVLDPYMHSTEAYRSLDSKFIGPNKRIKVKVNGYSHPMTYSANKAVCPDTTEINSVRPALVHASKVTNPSEVIMMADGCQNPGNLGQSNASAYKLASAVGSSGPAGQASQPIPVGPNADTSAGDGWFRYANDKCHVVFCDGSAKAFMKGTILKRNIWVSTN